MAKENLEQALEQLLQKLNQSAEKVVETAGYTEELEKVRILEELIKEQLVHENPRYSTRQIR